MKSNWTDATTYSRSDKEHKQTAWENQTGEPRIWVSNGHPWYPGKRAYTCHAVGVSEAKGLNLPDTATPEQAQARAVAWVKARLKKMIDSLETETT